MLDISSVNKGGEIMEANEVTTKDYIYCSDCGMFVDLWKYDDIKDAGHGDCNWRYVTEKELKQCIKDCLLSGCFKNN